MLLPILRNEQAPLEIMLKDHLLYKYYEEDVRMHHVYHYVRNLVYLLSHEKPRAQTLEIGAGTGGCTSAVLGALGDTGFSSYDFTDVSAGFFQQARQKFDYFQDILNYKKLDIETDPLLQGFEEAR